MIHCTIHVIAYDSKYHFLVIAYDSFNHLLIIVSTVWFEFDLVRNLERQVGGQALFLIVSFLGHCLWSLCVVGQYKRK